METPPVIARFPYRRLAGQVRYTLTGGPPSEEDHNIWNWYVSTALIGVTDGGLWVFLPVFLTRLGASPALLGLYTSLPALLSILLLIPAGLFLERVTKQMPAMVRIGLIGRAPILLIVLAPFFLPRQYLPFFIVAVWVLKTIPDSVGMPLWFSISARAVSPERRGHVNGTRWALLSLASACCQAIFGRALDGAPFPSAYQVVFAISLAGTLLELATFARLRVPVLAAGERPTGATVGQRLRDYFHPLVEHQPFVRYLAATLGYRVALNMPSAVFTLFWVRELKASDGLIGLRGSVGYVALVLGYLVWGRNANRLGHRRLLTVGAVGVAAYCVLSGLVTSARWLLPVAVLWGLAVPGIDIGIFDLLLDACPRGKETRFTSVALIGTNLAIFIGPLLGVALANATSLRTALIVAGLLQIAGTLAFRLLPKDV